jgi:hypothetical protein
VIGVIIVLVEAADRKNFMQQKPKVAGTQIRLGHGERLWD